MKNEIIILVFFLISVSPAFAHPGRTAADGCHYCRTNCASWGVAQDERHCHGGSTAPVVTASPTRVSTPVPTRVYTPTPTKVSTPTPTNRITPTSTIKPSVTPTPTETVQTSKVVRRGGFWAWLSRLFGGL